MKRLTHRQFMAAIATADHLFSARECGCLVVVMYDIPEVVNDDRDLIARESLAGRAIQRAPRGSLPPLNCAEHTKVPA